MKITLLRLRQMLINRNRILPKSRPSFFHAIITQASVLFGYVMLNLTSDLQNFWSLAKLRKMKNTQSALEALVLGNGPSLNKISFSKVKALQENGLSIFVVNYFPLIEGIDNLIPDYLVLSDPTTRPKNTSKRNKELWNWISDHKSVTLCVPYFWRKELDKIVNNVIYFNDSGLEGICRNINPVFPRGYASMTAYKALSLACFFGFSRISFLGIDNSNFKNMIVSEENHVLQQPFHFGIYGSTVDFTESLGLNSSRYFLDLSQLLEDLELFAHHELINLDSESVIDTFKKFSDLRILRE